MKWIVAILGILAVLLGGLWTAQGTGLLVVAPLFCVTECAPLEGPSPAWTVAGLALMLAGFGVLWLALRRMR